MDLSAKRIDRLAVTDRRPRCPPWRLSNQNMVACVAERAIGMLPVSTCPSCVVHRVRDQPAWEKFVVRVAIGRPKWGEKILLRISLISLAKHPGLVERSPKLPFSSLLSKY